MIKNLRIAFADELSRPGIEALAKANFRRTGANFACAARTARMSKTDFRKVLTVEGLENVASVIHGEKGVVILTPHMGNWEALSRLHLAMPEGVRLAAYYRPLNNPFMNRRVLKRREADGTRMFSKHESPLRTASVLAEPVCLGILADIRVGMAGEEVAFFGRHTRASPLPSLIARRAKCSVAALSMRTIASGKWVVTFRPVTLPHNTQNNMSALESAMRESPLDVFWMQDRWKISTRGHLGFSQWLQHPPAETRTKYRGLIWSSGKAEDTMPPDCWFHEEVAWERHIKQTDLDSPSLRTALREIDDAAALPLDVVISAKENPALRKAAARMSIAYFAWDDSPPTTRRRG